MEAIKRFFLSSLSISGILVLLVGLTACNMPGSSGGPRPEEPPPDEFMPEEHPPEDPPPGEPMPGEEHPPEEPPPGEPPPEEPPPGEPPPEPGPGDPGGSTGVIFGWDPSAAGSIMPVYKGACPASQEVGSSMVEPDGHFRIDNLPPGQYCVGALKTVTVNAGQEVEVSFP